MKGPVLTVLKGIGYFPMFSPKNYPIFSAEGRQENLFLNQIK